MNNELAAIVALAAHGDEWLHEGQNPAPRLDETDIFPRFRSVTFAILPPESESVVTAKSVESWFESLRRRGIQSCNIDIALNLPGTGPVDDYMVLGLAGRGRWQLIAAGTRTFEEWRASWTTTPPGGGDRAGRWDFSATGLVKQGRTSIPRVALARANTDLLTALEKIKRFAETRQLAPWADRFGEAIEALHTRTTPPHRVLHMVPDDYPPEAIQLLNVCDRAWVFGGMGSWSDLGPDEEDEETYRETTRRLYEAVLRGIVAAVNK